MHNLVKSISKETVFKVSEAVVHLDGSLRVADVEHLVHPGLLLDVRDVCNIVVQTHLSPGPVPIGSSIVSGIECFMAQGVPGATVAANPDIVSSVSQLQLEGLLLADIGLVFKP